MRTGETTTSAGTHDHAMPKWVARNDGISGVLHLIEVVVTTVLLLFFLGRGEMRERQIQDTKDQVREQLCQILDGLPQGGVLDITRDKLGCGPGLPLDAFSPEDRARLDPQPSAAAPSAPVPEAAPAPDADPESSPAAPAGPQQPPAPGDAEPLPGGADGPMTPSEPPPLSPPSQVRELVCALLPICPTEGT